jgi:hypothetical protein
VVEFVAAPETQERLGGVAPAFAVPQGLSLRGLGSLGLDQAARGIREGPGQGGRISQDEPGEHRDDAHHDAAPREPDGDPAESPVRMTLATQ